MLLAGLKTKRNFRHLQICPTTANASGYVSLPCVKGGGTAYAVTEGLSHYDLPNNPSCAFGASSPYTVEPPLRRDCKTEKCSMERGVKKFLLNFLTPQTTLVLTAESRHFATVFTRIQTRSRAKPIKIAVKCRIPDRHFTGAVKNIEFFYSPSAGFYHIADATGFSGYNCMG